MRFFTHLSVIIAFAYGAGGVPTIPRSSTTTEKVEILTAEYVTDYDQVTESENVLDSKPKTISELVHDQTEAIRKIVAEQSATPNPDFPTVPKYNSKTKAQLEIESIEELKAKCQQLSKLLRPDIRDDTVTTTTNRPTVQAFGPQLKPEFLKFPPQRPPTKQQMNGNYFIYTQNPQMYGYRINSEKLESDASEIHELVAPLKETTTPAPTKLKYVKLEPIVLQKTETVNGKPLYNWFRVLQTNQNFVQIPDTPENENVDIVAQPQKHYKHHHVPLPEYYKYYMDPNTGAIIRNFPLTISTTSTTTTSTTTTTPPPPSTVKPTRAQYFVNPETGMIYRAGQPIRIIHENHRRPSTTAADKRITQANDESAVVPNYTVEITEKKIPKEKVKHEFRFVIPLLVTGTAEELASNYPTNYNFDPLAFYPKELRSKVITIPVPFMHNELDRKIQVPNVHLEKN